jgi:uncharacterized protein (TIGR03435 family)
MFRPLVCLTLLLTAPASAQFEVASVKPSAPDQHSESTGITTRKGFLRANELTLKRYIMSAFAVGQHQIAGGPDWLNTDRFDITARAEQPVDDLMPMLQALLYERFNLVIHRETRLTQAYVLTVGKNGPKMENSPGGEASTTFAPGSIEATAVTMNGFAERLGRVLDLPVVNHTELDGAFNLKLQWARDESKPDSGPSLFTAIQQLGLRLTTQKVPIEILVIDRAEKPSEN